eukprot:contig_29221_g7182
MVVKNCLNVLAKIASTFNLFPLKPVSKPADEDLRARGVNPEHYREAVNVYGWRDWNRLLVFPSARGGKFKEMSYRYHCDNHSKVMVAAGVPEWFSKTHTCRRASTQKPKEAGASEQDNNEQGLWTEGVGGGAYNQNIPNRRATLGLSGRDLSCISLSTPRLKVVVPPELGALLFPWLEAAEAAYALRLAADKRNMDASLVDCFKLLRTMRPVYFQTWAARLAAGDVPLTAYVLRHPLLAGTGFAAFAATMVTALRSVEDRANEAAEQVLPQLAPTVMAAIKAVAPSTMAQLQDAEIYMAAQVDASTLAIQAHARQTAAAAMEHANVGVATVKRHTTKEVAELRKEVSQLRD